MLTNDSSMCTNIYVGKFGIVPQAQEHLGFLSSFRGHCCFISYVEEALTTLQEDGVTEPEEKRHEV